MASPAAADSEMVVVDGCAVPKVLLDHVQRFADREHKVQFIGVLYDRAAAEAAHPEYASISKFYPLQLIFRCLALGECLQYIIGSHRDELLTRGDCCMILWVTPQDVKEVEPFELGSLPTISEMSGFVRGITDGKPLKQYLEELDDE